MKNRNKFKKAGLYLTLTASGVTLLAACNGGGNSSSLNAAPVVNSSPLAEYKAALTYTPSIVSLNSKNLNAIGDTKQQSFTVPAATTLNLLSVRVTTFSTTTCNFGTQLGQVDMSGGETGVDFPTGTYTSSNTSNNALYSKMATAMTSGTPQSALGVRFDYRYNTINNGPGWVSAGCMSTGLANFETSNPGVACTGGSSACGFDTQQVAAMPTEYQRAVFVTAATTNGDIKSTANALPTNPNVATGIAGGNYICNYDVNKPARSAGAVFKAALFPQTVSANGKAYYRTDYSTVIISAANASNFLGATITAGYYSGVGAHNLQNSVTFMNPDILVPYTWVGSVTFMAEEDEIDACGYLQNSTTMAGLWETDNPSAPAGIGYIYSNNTSTAPYGYNEDSWNAYASDNCTSIRSLICVQQDD